MCQITIRPFGSNKAKLLLSLPSLSDISRREGSGLLPCSAAGSFGIPSGRVPRRTTSEIAMSFHPTRKTAVNIPWRQLTEAALVSEQALELTHPLYRYPASMSPYLARALVL